MIAMNIFSFKVCYVSEIITDKIRYKLTANYEEKLKMLI